MNLGMSARSGAHDRETFFPIETTGIISLYLSKLEFCGKFSFNIQAALQQAATLSSCKGLPDG